jgi:rare lipoprotein A (peptidoglycan hydrolase)
MPRLIFASAAAHPSHLQRHAPQIQVTREMRPLVLAVLLGVCFPFTASALAGNDGSRQPYSVQPYSVQAHSFQSRSLRAQPSIARRGAAEKRTFAQVGLASWYGGRSHGRRTASGQPFNSAAFTAAHRTLPFGTVVRVTNLKTGKVVKVRVNDRGPYRARRIVDLSAAAGRTLDIRQDGVAPVRLEVFSSDQGWTSGDSGGWR